MPATASTAISATPIIPNPPPTVGPAHWPGSTAGSSSSPTGKAALMEGHDCVFEFDRTWDLSVRADQLWATVAVPRRYCEWWKWLEEFDAEEFRVGADIPLVIKSPLWYRLHTVMHVDRLEPARWMDATISGDLAGPA